MNILKNKSTFRPKSLKFLPRTLEWIGGISLVTFLVFYLGYSSYYSMWIYVMVPLVSLSILIIDWWLKRNPPDYNWTDIPRKNEYVPLISWVYAALLWGFTLYIITHNNLDVTLSIIILFPVTLVLSLLVCSLLFSKKNLAEVLKVRSVWVIVITSFSITSFIVSNSLMFKLIGDRYLFYMTEPLSNPKEFFPFACGFIVFGLLMKIGLHKMYDFVYNYPRIRSTLKSKVLGPLRSNKSDDKLSIFPDTISAPEKIFCPNCSTLLIDGDTSLFEDEKHMKFCPTCGYEFKFEDLHHISKKSLLDSHRKTIEKLKNQKKSTSGM